VSVTDELIAHARNYAKQFDKRDLPLLPRRKLAIVACMDARLLPARLFGLEEGDAHVIRNAGGVVTDEEIRSLAISQRLLQTEEIILVHHTDCGMLKFTDDEFERALERDTGVKPDWSAQSFPDLDEDVRRSIAKIKDSPFIPHKHSVRGFVYEVETGALREVS
jgi:carbonic anhydrase